MYSQGAYRKQNRYSWGGNIVLSEFRGSLYVQLILEHNPQFCRFPTDWLACTIKLATPSSHTDSLSPWQSIANLSVLPVVHLIATVIESIHQAIVCPLLLFLSDFLRWKVLFVFFNKYLGLYIMCSKDDNLTLVICVLGENSGLICLMILSFIHLSYPWYSQDCSTPPKFKNTLLILPFQSLIFTS